MLACDSKKSFTELQNASYFQWQHVNKTLPLRERETTTTERPTTTSTERPTTTSSERPKIDKVVPGIVKLVLIKLMQ